jgi:hypothetical protein
VRLEDGDDGRRRFQVERLEAAEEKLTQSDEADAFVVLALE